MDLLVLSLPLPPSEKGNLLSLIGIVLSAAIALSSTTLLGNILAGLMILFRSARTGATVTIHESFDAAGIWAAVKAITS